MIVTFYSYKGGVGRTQLLANLAAYLCYYKDKKVLLIDWDLEAPGLHFFFQKENEIEQKKGVIDLFTDYVIKMRKERNLDEKDLPFFNSEEHILNVVASSGDGRIDIIPAGKYDSSFNGKVAQFDWFDFYDSLDGITFVEVTKKSLNRLGYDFIFIDSRTGFGDYSGICNVQLPQLNVMPIGPTKQNFWGIKKVINYLEDSPYIKNGKFRKPIIMPILSRLDMQSNKNTEQWVKKFKEEFGTSVLKFIQFFGDNITIPSMDINKILDRYVSATILPYKTGISYGEEILFTVDKKTLQVLTLEENFREIASILEFFAMHNENLETTELITTSEFLKTIKEVIFPEQKNETETTLEKLIKENPKNSSSYLTYALVLKEKKDYNGAEKFYLKAIELDEKNADYHAYYGVFLYNERMDFNGAELYFKKAMELDPNLGYNLGNYASLLCDKRNDYDKAEEFYKRAIELEPMNATTLGNYAIFLKTTRQDYPKAEYYYERALEFGADNAKILTLYAVFLKTIKMDYDKAEDFYRKAIELDRTYLIAHKNYGDFLFEIRKDYGKAEELFKKAMAIDPNNANNLGSYLRLLFVLDRQSEAKEIIRKIFIQENIGRDLICEVYFYMYAHAWKDYPEAKVKLLHLLDSGVNSLGWDLSENIRIAIDGGHPEPDVLKELAERISNV